MRKNTGKIILDAMRRLSLNADQLARDAGVDPIWIERMLRMDGGMRRIDKNHRKVLDELRISYSQVKEKYTRRSSGQAKQPSQLYLGAAEKVATPRKRRENVGDRYFIFDTSTNAIVARFDRL